MTNNRAPNSSSSKMKRAPKPFTVEVKRSRRTKLPFATPLSVEAETSVAALTAIEIVSAEPPPQGRILLALKPPEPSPEPAPKREVDEVNHEPVLEVVTVDAEPGLVAVEHGVGLPAKPYRTVVRPTVNEWRARRPKSADKLPREAFRRGERWKHRLPRVVHRSARGQPTD